MSQPSTKGRQERRGSRTVSALPGRSAAARARSLQRTRRAAAELAAHRRRLLATSIEGGEGEDLLGADAMLLRVEPAAHEAGLLRVAQAALAVAEDSHLTQLKAAAGDSRPPELAHNGTPAIEANAAAVDYPPEPPRDFPRGPMARTDLRPTDSAAPSGRIPAREGEGSTPSSRRSGVDATSFPIFKNTYNGHHNFKQNGLGRQRAYRSSGRTWGRIRLGSAVPSNRFPHKGSGLNVDSDTRSACSPQW